MGVEISFKDMCILAAVLTVDGEVYLNERDSRAICNECADAVFVFAMSSTESRRGRVAFNLPRAAFALHIEPGHIDDDALRLSIPTHSRATQHTCMSTSGQDITRADVHRLTPRPSGGSRVDHRWSDDMCIICFSNPTHSRATHPLRRRPVQRDQRSHRGVRCGSAGVTCSPTV